MKAHSIGFDEITPANILTFDLEGVLVAGTARPHSERFIHSEIFRARPDVNVVIHTHPTHTVALSATGQPMRPSSQGGAMFTGALPVYTETMDLIRTQAMGRSLAACLGSHHAVLMRSHGVTMTGPSLEQAVVLCVMLEEAARVQLLATAAGGDGWEFPPRGRGPAEGEADEPGAIYRQLRLSRAQGRSYCHAAPNPPYRARSRSSRVIHRRGAFPGVNPGSGAARLGPAEDQPDSRKGHAPMAMPDFTLRQLLEAGVHFGHHTRRWNPRMGPYIFGIRNQVHIIDLQQTVPMLDRALRAVRDVTAAGGRVLFVGTKRAAAEYVADSAKRCGQYYVNHRWLGGMLTNWKTITGSIKRLRQIEEMLGGNIEGLTKKEVLDITRDQEKLERALGGIKDMGGLPDILFIIDTNKEKLAVEEATKLGIPVVAVLDSNSDPTGVTYPIPGNDDAIRAITMYCDLVAGAVLDGISAEMVASGRDLGASEELPHQALVQEAPAHQAPAQEAPAHEAPAHEALAPRPEPEAPAEQPAA